MRTTIGLVVLGCLLADQATAADAKKIIADVRDAQIERWEGVALYKTTIETMGMGIDSHFQRFALREADGSIVPSFHEVGEADFRCGAVPTEPMSEAEIMAWLASRSGGLSEMEDGELPAGADAGAMPMLSRFMDSVTLAGEESVNGSDAWHLVANDIDMSGPEDAPTFNIDDYELWVDQRTLQMVRVRMVGQVDDEGETRNIDMSIDFSDFRDVAGSAMNMPFAQSVKMTGAMSAEEQAQMDEAIEALAEMEKELAAMPESQRAMVENMMGDRLQMMRDMVSGGAITFESQIQAVAVNIDAEGQTCSL
ncbi:MAG: hypothetical protein AAAFM81_00290 [Pseudomonadota bacterium]